MKKIYLALTVIVISTFLFSCKKNGFQVIDQKIDAVTPQIKYFNFGINSPSVNFYASTTKVAGVTSSTGAESTAGVTYGSVYPSTNYSLLTAGTYDFKAQIPSTATADANLSIATLNATLATSKFYSLYTCGFYNTTTKTSDAFILEDKLPAIDTSAAYIRFVNAVPNASSAATFSAKNTTTAVETVLATGVAYKTGSDFVKIPQGIYDLIVRHPSSATTVVTGTLLSTSLIKGRLYTLSVRGDITVTSTTAVNRLNLSFNTNR
ncbi:MAG: DUF4397 domain-containing protein [Sphingobacteriaceae bacterium]|nr:MAG: DUF4397 domain-containing protein [Sphingobacteriaceae bacterium]